MGRLSIVMETSTIRISKELLEQLKILANEQFRSVPKTIEWLLYKYRQQVQPDTAQEYCEREPMKSLVLEAMREHGISTSVEELFE